MEFEAYKFEIFSAIILHMGIVTYCDARNVIHGFEISAFPILLNSLLTTNLKIAATEGAQGN